jgi:hypothetical protein
MGSMPKNSYSSTPIEFPKSYVFMGFQGTYSALPTSLGFVSYWVSACDIPLVTVDKIITPEVTLPLVNKVVEPV